MCVSPGYQDMDISGEGRYSAYHQGIGKLEKITLFSESSFSLLSKVGITTPCKVTGHEEGLM